MKETSTYLLKRYLLEKAYEEGRCSLTDNCCEKYIKELLENQRSVSKHKVDEQSIKILKLKKDVPFVFSGEVYLQELLFQKLKNGELKFDEKDFNFWLGNLIRSKISFGKILKDFDVFDECDEVFEVSESKNISTIGLERPIKTEIILSPVGDGCNTRVSNKYNDGHLLINGMYDNEFIYLLKAISNGSFTVGYYGQKDSLYTERVIKYYKRLYRRILKMYGQNFPISLEQENVNNNDKVLVLSYNSRLR